MRLFLTIFFAMLFSEPLPFLEAVNHLRDRQIMPTSMTSEELSRLDAAIKRRSFFSAQNTLEGYLAHAQDVIARFTAGEIDQATARLALKEFLDAIDYKPADPDDEDTIKDFRSDRRLDLVIETNTAQAQGFGQYTQGQDPAILNLWPAQELYRGEARVKEREWPSIWEEAGGQTFDAGRMIALKDDAVWEKISDFGNPYPPFKFGSGMDVRDVERDEAMRFGLIDLTTQVQPQLRDFAQDGEEAAQ